MLSDRIGRGTPLLDALRMQTLAGPAAASQASGPLTAAQFLTLAADAGLTAERVFTPGAALDAVDGGAGGAYTLNVVAGDGITLAGDSVAVDSTVARSSWAVTAGAGMTGGGNLAAAGITLNVIPGDTSLTVAANDMRVNAAHNFPWTGLQTWSQVATFNAGATIAAGQNLNFGADVSLTRKNTNLLALAAGDSLQSTSYTSGLNGWNIDADGKAEFLDVRVRGELSAFVMKISELSATAGSFGVFRSAAALYEDYTAPGAILSSNTIKANNSDVGASLFAVNSLLRIKSFTGAAIRDLSFTVTAVGTNNTTHTLYTVRLESGTVSTTFRAGTAIADYGPTGSGFVILSADGTVGSSANLTIATHAGAPWTSQTIRVRLGNLNGSYGVSTDLFGFGVGDYTGGNYLAYNPTDGFEMRIGNGAIAIGQQGIRSSGGGNVGFYADAGFARLTGLIDPNEAGGLRAGMTITGSGTSAATDGILTIGARTLTVSETANIGFYATGASGGYASVYGVGTFVGMVIGSALANTIPNAMLDVRGSGIFTGNVTIEGGLGIGTGLPSAAGSIWGVMPAVSGGTSPRMLFFTPGAHTAMTVEVLDVLFSLNRTIQYANASIPATNRAFAILAPTIAAVSAGGTLADAGTFVLNGAPVAGTNLTITRSMALWVQGGWSRLAGGLSVGTGTVAPGAGDIIMGGDLTLAAGSDLILDATTGTKIGTATTQKLGFWNATPIVRPSAFTQNYSTAIKTHGVIGAVTPTAYVAGANGYSTGAKASEVHAAVVALIIDIANVKQVLNAVIDDLQLEGLLG